MPDNLVQFILVVMDSSSDEYDEENGTPKPRLNMSHGFIHHIRENQIAR